MGLVGGRSDLGRGLVHDETDCAGGARGVASGTYRNLRGRLRVALRAVAAARPARVASGSVLYGGDCRGNRTDAGGDRSRNLGSVQPGKELERRGGGETRPHAGPERTVPDRAASDVRGAVDGNAGYGAGLRRTGSAAGGGAGIRGMAGEGTAGRILFAPGIPAGLWRVSAARADADTIRVVRKREIAEAVERDLR